MISRFFVDHPVFANVIALITILIGGVAVRSLPIEQYHPEIGHGQQELTLGHATALRAADNQVLYRETVRGVAFPSRRWRTAAWWVYHKVSDLFDLGLL